MEEKVDKGRDWNIKRERRTHKKDKEEKEENPMQSVLV